VQISSVHAALKAATARRHERLEVDADVEARLRDRARRADAVAGLHNFHDQTRAVTAPFADLLSDAGAAEDGRAAGMARDLAILGGEPLGGPSAAPAADLSTALGWLYVAEGSALGGRVMRKAMIRDGIDLTGLDFLDASGSDVGARWSRVLGLLSAAVADGRATQEAVISAALSAFDHAREALVPAHVRSRAA